MKKVGKPQTAIMHSGPGYRIKKKFERYNPNELKELTKFDTPAISDQLNRLYSVSPSIKLLTKHSNLIVGQACTVKVVPGDNLMVHKALDFVKNGDIIVVDANGSDSSAVLGDLVTIKAQHRGVVAMVADGFVRDIVGIEKTNVAIFARGITPNGPFHRGPGEINYPIQCGGVVVNPGDVIVGDRSGVVIIPCDFMHELISRLKEKFDKELHYKNAVIKGDFSNKWVDDILNNEPLISD